MSDRVIARLICGQCEGDRSVMARLVDSRGGAVLQATYRRASHETPGVRRRAFKVSHDVPLAAMVSAIDASNGAWEGNPAEVDIGCVQHGRVIVTSEYLREVEAEYRRTGRPVTRVLDHPRKRDSDTL